MIFDIIEYIIMEWTVECRMTTELGTQDVQEGTYPKKKEKVCYWLDW